MKTAIIHVEGTTQVMLQGENDHERSALALLASSYDGVGVEFKTGEYDAAPRYGFPSLCSGGWLRPFEAKDCLMLVVRKKEDRE